MSDSRPIHELVFCFRPRGAGRFAKAAFLAVWLCGWFAGEALALFVLGHGIVSLLTDRPFADSDQPAQMVPALAVGAFLLVWLSFWTVGGVLAIREFLRAVWAEDRLVLDRETLVRSHGLGPFTFMRRLARHDIRRVYLQPANTVLMAQLEANVIALTNLGTPGERTDAARLLCTALGLPGEDPAAYPAVLPERWQETTGPRGERLLIPNLQFRRKQAVIVAIVTGIVWTGLLLLAREIPRKPGVWPVTLMLTALAVWLVRQTHWMFLGRKEWRLEQGRLIHQRRWSGDVTELAEARALEISESSDSDGDTWYQLNAIELTATGFARAPKRPGQLRLAHAIHDQTEPRCLGLWLSQQAGIPLHDRVPTAAAKQAERTRLKAHLASTGRFGRFLAGRVGSPR